MTDVQSILAPSLTSLPSWCQILQLVLSLLPLKSLLHGQIYLAPINKKISANFQVAHLSLSILILAYVPF